MNLIITPTKRFYVVTNPTPRSCVADICFETNLTGLELQFKGGLTADKIHGIYTDRNAAITAAQVLLQKEERKS